MFSIGVSLISTKSFQVADEGLTLAKFWNFCSVFRTNEFKICEGLRESDYLHSIAKDPLAPSHSSYSVSDVVRHIVPKNIGMETNYRVMVILRSVDCMVLFDKDV